jgi:hypothetical protein
MQYRETTLVQVISEKLAHPTGEPAQAAVRSGQRAAG